MSGFEDRPSAAMRDWSILEVVIGILLNLF